MGKLWTPPPTFTDGPKFRVGEFNTYARDNLTVVRERPGALANFTAVTDRPPELAAPAGGWFTVPLNSERRDSGGIHDNESSSTRIKVPAGSPGLWLITAHADLLYDAAGPGGGVSRAIGLRVNGQTFIGVSSRFRTLTTEDGINAAVLALLSEGDYVELCAYHDSTERVVVENRGLPMSPELRAQFLCEVQPNGTTPSWKGLKTWANHEVLDASDLNDQFRDNPNFLRYRPMALMNEVATQSVGTGAWTTLNLGTMLGQNGVWNGTANQLTVPTGMGGLYLIHAAGALEGSATGTVRRLGVLHSSGNRILVKSYSGYVAENAFPNWSIARLFRLAAGDTLKVQAFQDTGAGLNTRIVNGLVTLGACWMAP